MVTARANSDEPRNPASIERLGESERRQLAERVRAARRHIGLLQEDVAGTLDLSRSTISAIERGARRIRPFELRRMARLYHTPVSWFLDETELSDSLLHSTKDLAKKDKGRVLRSAEIWAGTTQPY